MNEKLVEELVRRVLAAVDARGGGVGVGGAAEGRPATGRPATGRPATGRPATGLPATGHPITPHPAAAHSATLPASWPPRHVAVGSDHGGFERKEQLRSWLTAVGYEVFDCGTGSASSVDYPDLAAAVARQVSTGRCQAGIVVDGAGIGSAMAANKIAGVRCATCWSVESVLNAREHNDANVLSLGSGFVSFPLARRMAELFLKTPHGGGRHLKRVAKIMELEK